MVKPYDDKQETVDDEGKAEERSLPDLECKGRSDLSQNESLKTEAESLVEAKWVSALESEYSCAICNGVFIDPSTLLCGHTFCLHCLRQWLSQRKKCPICREPRRETNDPKKNVSISSMIERAYGELLSNEDLRTKRADALKEREEEVKKAAGMSEAVASQIQIPIPLGGDEEHGTLGQGLMEQLEQAREQNRRLRQTIMTIREIILEET